MDAGYAQWQVMDALRRLGGHMERKLQPFCTQQGVTPLQLSILMALHFEGPQTVTALARRNCMAGGNNSALCKKLEKDGLVVRERIPEDERQVQVSLSSQGQAVVQRFSYTCASLQIQEKEFLTPEEIELISTAAQILLRHLEKKEEASQ